MIKRSLFVTAYAVAVFAIIAGVGIFFQPVTGGTPTRSLHVETVCTHDCPGHHNTGRRHPEND